MVHQPETKFRETLRNLGYMAGMTGGLVGLIIIFFCLDIIVASWLARKFRPVSEKACRCMPA